MQIVPFESSKKGSPSKHTSLQVNVVNNKQRRRKNNALSVRPYNPLVGLPDTKRVTLRYWKATSMTLSSGSEFNSVRFTPSSAYDVDPSIGSTAAPGFAEMAAIYSTYRVVGSRCTVEIINTGQVPAEVTLVPMNQDPGSLPLASVAILARSQPWAQSKMVPLAGGPSTRLVSAMTTRKIYGNRMADYDDHFTSLTNTVPLNNWYWFITLYALEAPSATKFFLNVTVDIDVEFFDRKYLLS